LSHPPVRLFILYLRSGSVHNPSNWVISACIYLPKLGSCCLLTHLTWVHGGCQTTWLRIARHIVQCWDWSSPRQ